MTVTWTADTCALGACGHFHEITVQHPSRGAIDVCGYHARQIRQAFGEIEVEL